MSLVPLYDGSSFYLCVDPFMALSKIPKAHLKKKRLTVTLEDYQDSKVVCASLLAPEEESITSVVLERLGVQFVIEEVQVPLFHYRLDYGKSHVDLQLRTKAEIAEWIARESFEETAAVFLDSDIPVLRLALDRHDAFLEISRQAQQSMIQQLN